MAKHEILVTLRIPGVWANSRELSEAIPAGCALKPDLLILGDGTEFEVNFRQPDDQFVSVFANSCRSEPTKAEKNAIENYTVQVCLTGPGGSVEAAAALMRAGDAILQAGGAGVFIDNSGISFGASFWQEMTQNADIEALSFAFVNIVNGRTDTFTVGMHVLGLPDLQMPPEDIGAGGAVLLEMIQYLCSRTKNVGNGHVIADLDGPRFVVSAIKDKKIPPHSPMHNPWGRLRLIMASDISERN